MTALAVLVENSLNPPLRFGGRPHMTAAARGARGEARRGRKTALDRTEKRDQDDALQPGGLYF